MTPSLDKGLLGKIIKEGPRTDLNSVPNWLQLPLMLVLATETCLHLSGKIVGVAFNGLVSSVIGLTLSLKGFEVPC